MLKMCPVRQLRPARRRTLMSPLKVGCPNCHAALSATPPFPPGMMVKCSLCGALFPMTEQTAIRPLPADLNRAPAPVAVGVSPPPRRLVTAKRPRQPWLAIAAIVVMVLIAFGIVTYVIVQHGKMQNGDTVLSQDDNARDAASATAAHRPEPLALSTPEVDDGKSRTRIYQHSPDRRSR